jgi:multicomponent Na+:H+ antiporter subunit B
MKFKDGIKEKNIIIKCGSDVFLPFSLIFALYVILTAPVGGGFQGGVLGAAAVLLIYLGYGYDVTKGSINPEILRINEACATTIYALLGFAGLVFGANFLIGMVFGLAASGYVTIAQNIGK